MQKSPIKWRPNRKNGKKTNTRFSNGPTNNRTYANCDEKKMRRLGTCNTSAYGSGRRVCVSVCVCVCVEKGKEYGAKTETGIGTGSQLNK